MEQFQYEWYTVCVREATGLTTWEVKAKSKDSAVKQIKMMARKHDDFVQKVRQDFCTEIFWETMKLDRKGYNRRF